MTDNDRFIWFTIVLLAVIVLANTVLFEDGSIQVFHMLGWGICILPAWGC